MNCHWCGLAIPNADHSWPEHDWRSEGGIARCYHRTCFEEMMDQEASQETEEEARAALDEDQMDEWRRGEG